MGFSAAPGACVNMPSCRRSRDGAALAKNGKSRMIDFIADSQGGNKSLGPTLNSFIWSDSRLFVFVYRTELHTVRIVKVKQPFSEYTCDRQLCPD